MPTYEYRCKACGQDLEVVQAFTDDALTTCEACGGPLRKVFGNVGIAFKGSGFYKNDSRSKTSSTSASTSSTSSSGSDSGSTGTGSNGASSSESSSSTSSSTATPSKPSSTSSSEAKSA